MSDRKGTNMWTRFDVRWDFVTSLCASVPGKSNLIEGWLKARMPKVRPPEARSIDDIAAEVAESMLAGGDEHEQTTLVFQRFNGVLSVRMATVRAHIKDCAYQISTYYTGRIKGEKSFSVRVKNNLYWPPEQPYVPLLGQDGRPLTEPSGVREKAVHFQTAQGPRSALKAFEYVDDTVLKFSLLVLTQPDGTLVVSETDIKTLFTYGGVHGYGGERSEDGGRYGFTITQTQEG